MSPKWHNLDKNEVEKLAQKALKATNNKNSMYARIYWVAAQLIYKNTLFIDSDVDWTRMSDGIDEILDEYPSQYNLNHFAYYACMSQDKDKTQSLISQMYIKPLRDPWKSQKNFDSCKKWSNTETIMKYVTNVSPSKLEEYIKEHSYEKPVFIHFSSYDEKCQLCEVRVLEEIAKDYHTKVNFVSVNFSGNYSAYKYMDLYSRYYLRKIPSSVIVYEEKTIVRQNRRSLLEKYMDENIKRLIDDMLMESKEKYFSKLFKKTITDNASFANTDENIRTSTHDYLGSRRLYKSLAIAVSIKNDTWVIGRALSYPSQLEANEEALKDCERDRTKMNSEQIYIEEKCKLYMIDKMYVYEKTENEIKKLMNNINK